MSRKSDLKYACLSSLRRIRQGSPYTKRDRLRLLFIIIEDLATLRQLPRQWSEITPAQIHQLVIYWRTQSLSLATLANRLGALRTFNRLARLNLTIPTNRILGIQKFLPAPNTFYIPSLDILYKKIHHPLTRHLIACQCLFGLTKWEAIRLSWQLLPLTDNLLVPRHVAHNHRDRTIPIATPAQQQCLQERASLEPRKLYNNKLKQAHWMNQLYQAECRFATIDPKTPFRKVYARDRLKQLQTALPTIQPNLVLSREMGTRLQSIPCETL